MYDHTISFPCQIVGMSLKFGDLGPYLPPPGNRFKQVYGVFPLGTPLLFMVL